jgi:predicted extracellular nuclease
MAIRKSYILFGVFLLCCLGTEINLSAQNRDQLRLAFYNVENLFDTINDPLTNDDEFTPAGMRGWYFSRYLDKLDHIYKTITAIGEWDPPAVVGFCEIENRGVLYDLVAKTPFVKNGYEIIHQDSPDKRGIDVGLIYHPKFFKPIRFKAIRVDISKDSSSTTRDILYVCGKIFKTDTVHIFINHWPSRSGGQAKSEARRIVAASTLRLYVDSIFLNNPRANIVIMGDFNDEPGDASLYETLRAKEDTVPKNQSDLFNGMYSFFKKEIGTEKFQDHWHCLDQVIMSYSLLDKKNKVLMSSPQIFRASWLVEPDEKYLGDRPFRTYAGPKYLGGYSDHLPVYVDLIRNH